MDLRQIGCAFVELMKLTEDRIWWGAFGVRSVEHPGCTAGELLCRSPKYCNL
jgi:hypothetical protein